MTPPQDVLNRYTLTQTAIVRDASKEPAADAQRNQLTRKAEIAHIAVLHFHFDYGAYLLVEHFEELAYEYDPVAEVARVSEEVNPVGAFRIIPSSRIKEVKEAGLHL